jgi:hypothetical protein
VTTQRRPSQSRAARQHDSRAPTRALDEVVSALRRRDPAARRELEPLLRRDLRRQVHRLVRAARAQGAALDAAAIVEDALGEVLDGGLGPAGDNDHLMAAVAPLLRGVVVRHARAERAGRAPGRPVASSRDPAGLDLLRLDRALRRLAALDPGASRLAEARLFGGLSTAEAAQAAGVDTEAARQEWRFARTWIFRDMARRGDPRRTARGGAR